MAFPPGGRSYELKVNRKARKAALRAALTQHAQRGSLAVVDAASLGETPSTKTAVSFVGSWGADRPLLVVVLPEETVVAKSFRNLEKTLVLEIAELEVTALVWARSVLLSEGALARVQEVAR